MSNKKELERIACKLDVYANKLLDLSEQVNSVISNYKKDKEELVDK